MVSRKEFVKLVGRLSQQVVDAPDRLGPIQRNEEWTKINFILPLLEGLGWDRLRDVNYEDSSQDGEGRLNFILMCQPPIGIEAKALDVKPPEDRSHPQIKKGLKQSKEREASYFIWTNGDCWQFFSLALSDAPMYDLRLSNAYGNPVRIQHIASEFHVIAKELFTANPKHFDKAIRENWKTAALPDALHALVNEHANDLVKLVRKSLPIELGIEDEEILQFFRALKPPGASDERTKKRIRSVQKSHSFPVVNFAVRGRVYRGLIENNSDRGFFIKTEGHFSEGQDISMITESPGKKITGKIVRVTPHGIGVEFN